MKNVLINLGIFLLFAPGWLSAQANTGKDTLVDKQPFINKSSFVVLPVLFYQPETRLGFGGLGLLAFRFRGESPPSRSSQTNLAVAYTLEKQLLVFLPYQLYWKENKNWLFGEFGYYRYFYQFYGIGNQTREIDEEPYSVNFPRVRINYLRLARKNLYLGMRYWFDDYDIVKVQEGGLLETQSITGNQGGVISSLGFIASYDGRDNVFYPKKGTFIQALALTNQKFTGSDFSFNRYLLDARFYHTIGKNQILALNAYAIHTAGNAPFQELAFIGGSRRMRGFFEGRFRDNNVWILQAEYRFPLFWRFSGVVFSGIGSVSPNIKNYFKNKTHWSFGAGLRILSSDTDPINLRIDLGVDEDFNMLPYFTIGEAF